MEKKVKIGEPFVNCYSKFAALTSILAIDDRAVKWGILHYSIPMYMRSKQNEVFWMDLRSDENTVWEPEWKLCPFIDGDQIETAQIIDNGTFSGFLINCIDKNYCIYTDICVTSIKEYHTKSERQHDLFIYGYDLEEHIFICRDYFSIKYEERRIPFEELEDAFKRKAKCETRKDYNFIYKFRDADRKYTPTLEEYRLYIKKMLYPVNFYSYEPGTEKRFEFYFGTEAYRHLFQDYKNGVLEWNDLRPLYVIRNHLQLLKSLSDCFALSNEDALHSLIKQHEIICHLAIKLGITKNEGIKEKIIALSDDFISKEEQYLEKILTD